MKKDLQSKIESALVSDPYWGLFNFNLWIDKDGNGIPDQLEFPSPNRII